MVRAAAFLADPGISVSPSVSGRTGGVTALHDPTEGGFAMRRAIWRGGRLRRPHRPRRRTDPAGNLAIAAALGLDPLGMLASGSLLVAAPPERHPI